MNLLAAIELTPTEIVSGTVSVIFMVAAIYERVRNRKKDERTDEERSLLSSAESFRKQSEIFRAAAEDNAKLYERERNEHTKTRDYWHEQANKFNAAALDLQGKIAELQSRPDYAQILHFIEQQAETSVQILSGIREILIAFKAATLK